MRTLSEMERDVSHVTAKLAAVEAVVVQIMATLLDALEPGLAGEVLSELRAFLNLAIPTDVDRLAAEEYLQRFADDIERRIRTKAGAHR